HRLPIALEPDVEAQGAVLLAGEQRLPLLRLEPLQHLVARAGEVAARDQVPEQPAGEHEHVGDAVLRALRHELETAVRAGAAPAPRGAPATPLPELDHRVGDRLAAPVADPAPDPNVAARDD